MSAPGDFVDTALQNEASYYRAAEVRERLGHELQVYGSSVGAVRGTIRDMLKKYPGLDHDEVTALASELWSVPVFERRLAAVVLLQSSVSLLLSSDLTRLEGFVRAAEVSDLVDPLAVDVLRPLLKRLDPASRARADLILDRWSGDPSTHVRRAAQLARAEPSAWT